MKKNFKLVLALVLVAMMMVTSAFAATTFTEKSVTSTDCSLKITNTGKTAHTFELYQIFKGDVNADGKLSNIVWGDDVTSAGQTALGTAAEVAKGVTDANDANAFAHSLRSYLTGATSSDEVAANGNYTFTGLNPGYYLVIDKATTQDNKENGAYTAYVMEVVGAAEANTKIDVPSVAKKVKDMNDVKGTLSEWQDAADHDIGDSIPYQITATLPGNFDAYKFYKTYTITDTMDNGLTAPAAKDVTITIDPTISTAVDDIFDIKTTAHGITITLKDGVDLKTIEGITKSTKFIVTYNATLNGDAVVGPTGNANEVKVTYDNNPNWDGIGTPNTGDTPKDKVIVFTYTPQVDKVNSENKPLEGAGFTLYKEVSASYKANEGETVKTGAAIKTELAAENASINAAALKNDAKYVVKAMTQLTGDATKFDFKGIDAGTYVLVETTIPAGYNAFVAETIVVTAEYDTESDNPKLTKLEADKVITTVQNSATLEGNVVNQSGATLPSTGGIGTTIFYVAGSIMVLAAAILLVTKRRMGAND